MQPRKKTFADLCTIDQISQPDSQSVNSSKYLFCGCQTTTHNCVSLCVLCVCVNSKQKPRTICLVVWVGFHLEASTFLVFQMTCHITLIKLYVTKILMLVHCSPLVRSTYCSMKIDLTSEVTQHSAWSLSGIFAKSEITSKKTLHPWT